VPCALGQARAGLRDVIVLGVEVLRSLEAPVVDHASLAKLDARQDI
jgi:hypothetical protein